MAIYLALLRGINVGGKNIIKMKDLKSCLEENGFKDVTTYIQSGNVIFRAHSSATALTKKIETVLSGAFNYKSSVVVIPQTKLNDVLNQAPRDFGKKPETYRYDVIFLKSGLTPKVASAAFKTKDGVDKVSAGKHAVYYSRLISKATQSQMSRITQTPEYQMMTIRNWNTATKLQKMMKDLQGA